jgi:hypothetical protein
MKPALRPVELSENLIVRSLWPELYRNRPGERPGLAHGQVLSATGRSGTCYSMKLISGSLLAIPHQCVEDHIFAARHLKLKYLAFA